MIEEFDRINTYVMGDGGSDSNGEICERMREVFMLAQALVGQQVILMSEMMGAPDHVVAASLADDMRQGWTRMVKDYRAGEKAKSDKVTQ